MRCTSSPSELDLACFRGAGRAGGRRRPAPRRRATLREALALWRGPALADLAYEPFAQAARGAARGAALQRARAAHRRRSRAGEHAQLVGELEALAAQHPLRERLRAQLMLALYRAGRQADALEAYQAARATLVEELGIEPGRALRELHQAILGQDERARARRPRPRCPSGHRPAVCSWGARASSRPSTTPWATRSAAAAASCSSRASPGSARAGSPTSSPARARARDAQILVGRCWEAGGAPAYWPWVQALRTYVRDSERRSVATQLSAADGDSRGAAARARRARSRTRGAGARHRRRPLSPLRGGRLPPAASGRVAAARRRPRRRPRRRRAVAPAAALRRARDRGAAGC